MFTLTQIIEEVFEDVKKEVDCLSTEIYDSDLSDDTNEVIVVVAGYIARSLTKRFKCNDCQIKLILQNADFNKEDDYLDKLSRGGLIKPSDHLREFVSQSFLILDHVSEIVKKKVSGNDIRKISEKLLDTMQDGMIFFVCNDHEKTGKKFALRATINIFFNNEQKLVNETIRKDEVKTFKSRQTRKKNNGDF